MLKMLPAANLAVVVTFSNQSANMNNDSGLRQLDLAQPVLSVLIPAFDYAQGVLQIIVPLIKEGRADLEILVHDDSNDDHVECAVQSLTPLFSGLHYLRNRPARGAIENWNSLLSSAKGRYVLLVHHDDFPLSEHFASDLIADLERHAWPDILLLTCITHDVVRDRLRPGICNRLRQLVVRRYPFYLLRRNLIGPPATMVVRRDLVEPFDTQLKWLVDVEAYYRFFAKTPRRVQFSRLIMVSSTGLPGAITTGIQNDKSRITRSEIAHISNKFPSSWKWSVLRGQTQGARLILGLEWLLWASVKAVNKACQLVAIPRVSLATIRRRRNLAEKGI
jgi:glycosyltransferase involved in cell wall biosynthesis